ncbi:hypothetical protein Cch02nite_42420 [Catellatospora chokoriensis]|uniref:5-bromo-4-chloroindolyl phosphate hydrolysis protein n=2 Tax=Catellatospora chokoriensis TaxID=310353 RepID=A0A8J3K5U1_9ACTN|nr:hypothetical protein Cch02nite_42420 [Catellatospora chokoriensis]
MRKVATPLALLVAVGVFGGLFAVTDSLLWSPLLAALCALGVYLMLDSRTTSQVRDDEYGADADRKADEVVRAAKEIRKLSRDVASPSVKHLLQQAAEFVPELLERVRATSPNSLYSSASQLGAHLQSLHGVVRQYLDIQRNPTFYDDPAALLAGGEQAVQRFTEFTIDSLRLVNQGDLAQYQANLQTVAPPKLPQLG